MMDLKEQGNALFSKGQYTDASSLYTEALKSKLDSAQKSIILSNRAACYLKLKDAEKCIADCTEALALDASLVKALYRRALAQEMLQNLNDALQDLTKVIKMDSKNQDAVTAARRVKEALLSQRKDTTEVQKWVKVLIEESANTSNSLAALLEICSDNLSNALDFGRKGGLAITLKLLDENLTNDEIASQQCLRLLYVLTSQQTFLTQFYRPEGYFEASPESETDANLSLRLTLDGYFTLRCVSILLSRCISVPASSTATLLRLSLGIAANLLQHEHSAISDELISTEKQRLMEENQLRLDDPVRFTFPLEELRFLCYNLLGLLKELVIRKETESCICLCDFLASFISNNVHYFDRNNKALMDNSNFRNESMEKRRVRLRCEKVVAERVSHICRMLLRDARFVHTLISGLCRDTGDISAHSLPLRRAIGSLLGQFVIQLNDDEAMKPHLLPYLCYNENVSETAEEDLLNSPESGDARVSAVDDTVTLSQRLCRVSLETSLLATNTSLGSWCVLQRGGTHNLLQLLLWYRDNPLAWECVAEELCLAANVSSLSSVVSFFLSQQYVQQLLQSASPGVRAAAASIITKVTLQQQQQSKVLHKGSTEAELLLNAVLSVLKHYRNIHSNHATNSNETDAISSKAANSSTGQLVSFSAHDVTAHSSIKSSSESKHLNISKTTGAMNEVGLVSLERAVEVLAALCGHSFVKEELVHGSGRVTSCIPELLSLADEVLSTAATPSTSASTATGPEKVRSGPSANVADTRSTLLYGLSHVFAALTVTNRELRAIALAERDLSLEQFEQLQQLQKIKTNDENGNPFEEKSEEDDIDSNELCRQRIRKLVGCGAVKTLVKMAGTPHVSSATRDKAVLTLRQLCVDESIRGRFIQEGGLRLCCDLNQTPKVGNSIKKASSRASDHKDASPTDATTSSLCRREAAHAVAKCLVTTNPHLLSEHQRLGAIRPLVALCRDAEATQLQQFESLLSMTNLLSCGESEQHRFVTEKGVHAVHYLMFSSHLMVRRAATEAFCNLSQHEELLVLLRDREKLRLWLALIEDWDHRSSENSDVTSGNSTGKLQKRSGDEQEKFLTARAAMGTLAMACVDSAVVRAMLQEDCARTIIHALQQEECELIHRTLVCVAQMLAHDEEEPENQIQSNTNTTNAFTDNSNATRSVAKAAAQHLALHNVIPALTIATQTIQRQNSQQTEESELEELLRSIAETLGSLLKDT